MELGDGEAQICRLCGQCESIYIDVFGEEGTKRFLGLKIHTKINILIKENDGLPQIVCMRCLGTLEFLCEFYERCHIVQKELLQANQNEEDQRLQPETYVESDKENAAPLKTLLADNQKSIKNNLKQFDAANNVDNITKSRPVSDHVIPQKQPMSDNINFRDKLPSINHRINSNLSRKRSRLSKKIENLERIAFRASNFINDINSPHKNILNRCIIPQMRVRRNEDRRRKFEKVEESNVLANIGKEIIDDRENQTGDDCENESKGPCLQTICSDSYGNNNNFTSAKPQAEQTVPKERGMVAIHGVHITSGKSNELSKECGREQIENLKSSLINTDVASNNGKNLTILVKQEKLDTERVVCRENRKFNPFVWIPNEILMEEEANLVSDVKNVLACNDKRQVMIPEETRITGVKFPESYGIENTKVADKEPGDLCILADPINETRQSSLRRFSRHSFGENTSKSTYGKISKLLSDEQKQTIGTYYNLNMSAVDSEKVQKNITIIDKKNIRCNICGIRYLRMDKCQIHIWGHLQMKPYQCNVCDFATANIINMQCHVKKSHLKLKPYTCYLCEKQYATAILLKEHLNTHTGTRPYESKLSDFANSSRQALNYDVTTHETVKDNNCKICGKEFHLRGRLHLHMIVHKKHKLIKCKLSSAYLSSVEALKTHCKNVHMQDYICNVCGNAWNREKRFTNIKMYIQL